MGNFLYYTGIIEVLHRYYRGIIQETSFIAGKVLVQLLIRVHAMPGSQAVRASEAHGTYLR